VADFRRSAARAAASDTATILYTSGTTAEPKGVVLTHANIASNILATQDLFPFGSADVGFSFLPLSHVFERMLDYFYFWCGVSIAFPETLETMPQDLVEVRPTVLAVVPRVLERIHDRIQSTLRESPAAKRKLFAWALEVGRRTLPYELEGRQPPGGLRAKRAVAAALVYSKVRARMGGRVRAMISGAAPLRRELAEFFFSVGLPVYEGYGLTETSPVVAVNYPGHVKLGTVGPVIPGVEVRLGEVIEDEEGGSGREILVRGPNVTPGYYRDEQANREAFSDGWLHTGDLGALDADGYLSITGRKKHLFKTSGGKYVAPERLENFFQGHPYVAQTVVIGYGRKFVSALMVPQFAALEAYAREEGLPFSSREELIARPEILEFMQRQVDEAMRWLPPHERIRQIALLPKEFTVDSGELTPTLKIKRRVVEEKYKDVIEEIYRRPPTRPA
jgi:long-chain acyl-CoA synthetase